MFGRAIRTVLRKAPVFPRVPVAAPNRFFSDAPGEAVVENLITEQKGFKSRAIRDVVTGRYKNLPISCKKLRLYCKMLSGLSVREAMSQLAVSHHRKSVYLHRLLRVMSSYSVNTFNLDKQRLYISEITSTRGIEYKRLDMKGRGRAAIKHRRHAHLTIKIKEQPYREGEVRIGRYGRTIKSVNVANSIASAWKEKQAAL